MTTRKRNRNLDKSYTPDNIEQKWYAEWVSHGLFNAEINPDAKAFSIVIPPPNVTGSLHVGHAFDHTFQDIMCRTKRMEGYGFVNKDACYSLSKEFMDGDFTAEIRVYENGSVQGRVVDNMIGEEYIPLRMPNYSGAFVGSVRAAYEDLLLDIADKCCSEVSFASDQSNRIAALILDRYSVEPDFPWDEDGKNPAGVFRHGSNNKWFGLIMNIDGVNNGIVIDHIEAGKGIRIYEQLQLNKLEIYSHTFYRTAYIINNLHPEGIRVGLGVFGITIPTVKYTDLLMNTGAVRGDYGKRLIRDVVVPDKDLGENPNVQPYHYQGNPDD